MFEWKKMMKKQNQENYTWEQKLLEKNKTTHKKHTDKLWSSIDAEIKKLLCMNKKKESFWNCIF
jgi:hypothetical protein